MSNKIKVFLPVMTIILTNVEQSSQTNFISSEKIKMSNETNVSVTCDENEPHS